MLHNRLVFLASLLATAHGLPTPQIRSYGSSNGQQADITPTIVASPSLAPSGAGSLYGPSSLPGGFAPRSLIESAFVPQSENNLVTGQEADGSLGPYLDFNSANPPQPIHGDQRETNPGSPQASRSFPVILPLMTRDLWH